MDHIPLDPEEECRYWQWLDEPTGAALDQIKEKVRALYNHPDNRPLRFYTSHELSHCQAVEDLLHRLIPRHYKDKLTQRERFYLLASAWLHDIGMLSVVADRVWGRMLSDNEIRRCHHETSERFIRDYPYECGVEEVDKFFLAELCRYHRKREDLQEAAIKQLSRGQIHHFRLLAAYLRLADALHVEQTRTPQRDFILCLAYNIPPETKLHWIKSRLVSGIFPNADKHLISVQFQKPRDEDIRQLNLDPVWVNRKIDAVICYVMDELRDELASVMYVLTSGGITFFSEVQKTTAPGVDKLTLNHLMTLVINYDVLVWPSASRFLEMILITLAELLGYQLVRGGDPEKLPDGSAPADAPEHIRRFLDVLAEDLRSRRACHLGIRALLEACGDLPDKLKDSPADCINLVNGLYQKQHQHRQMIRMKTAADAAVISLPGAERICNILLYGYSELVVKALCGFRDRLLCQCRLDPHAVYNSELEMSFSKRFRLFVCDGQPKTLTAAQDRLMYHDGIAYAFALRKCNFTHLVLIPDIVVTSVLSQYNLDFLMVGANGFTDDTFWHSAGHGSIIQLIRSRGLGDATSPAPKILLVVSSDKYLPSTRPLAKAGPRPPSDADPRHDVDGYVFWTGIGENTRENVWITRDPRIRADLKAAGEHIRFYNPREDAVPIAMVDQIICDCGIFTIRAGDEGAAKVNIENFLKAVDQRRKSDRSAAFA